MINRRGGGAVGAADGIVHSVARLRPPDPDAFLCVCVCANYPLLSTSEGVLKQSELRSRGAGGGEDSSSDF